ncbi:MAG: helix-turn-helix domain-containing protein, partial [Oscillospiraceae bacterium]|nr:helix-turn-helix domain-containing protein [Oscillospiraceae bacterium]
YYISKFRDCQVFLGVIIMYISSDIAERIKYIAKQRNVAVKKVLEDTELGRNMMSNLKTSFPQSDSIAKIADYLDCSVDYLLGRTDNPQAHVKSTEVNNELVALIKQLNPEQQKWISLQIKGLLAENPPPKGDG